MRQCRIMVDAPPVRKTLCPYSVSLLPLTMMSCVSAVQFALISDDPHAFVSDAPADLALSRFPLRT